MKKPAFFPKLLAAALVLGFLPLSGVSTPSLAQKSPRERVAILTFKAIGTPQEMGEAVAEILRTELVDIGNFELVERGQIEALIQEQKLQTKDLFDVKTAVEIGRLSGAKLVVIGSIVKLGNTFTLNSRFIDVQTGIVRIGKNIRGNSENEISNMCRQLAYIIAGKAYAAKPPPKPPGAEPEKIRPARIPVPPPLPKLEKAPLARIEKVWTEHNVDHKGQRGFWIHTAFTIDNHRGQAGRLSVFFRFEGHPGWLKDYDKDRAPDYGSPSGYATTQEVFTPLYDSARFSDFKVFMPYGQLHLLQGRHDLQAAVEIRDRRQSVLAESTVNFWVNETSNQIGQRAPGAALASLPKPTSKPTARVEKVWLDHNVYEGGQKGMRIHGAFVIDNHQDRKGRFAVFFRYKNSKAWLKDFDRDRNPKYGSPTGEATIQEAFTPKYQSTRFSDFKVFMPYDQMHLGTGKYDLETVVQIHDEKASSLAEGTAGFTFTK